MKNRIVRVLAGVMTAGMLIVNIPVSAFAAETAENVTITIYDENGNPIEVDENGVSTIIIDERDESGNDDFDETLEATDMEDLMALMAMMMLMGGLDDTEEETSDGPLTPDGNMSILDDYGSPSGEGKQFITLTTKGGAIFYLIIDRDDSGTETVHFLNQVDESDILAYMEDEQVAEYDEWKASIDERRLVLDAEEEELMAKALELQNEKETPSETPEVATESPLADIDSTMIVIGGGAGLAVIVMVALTFMKKKKKPETKPTEDYSDDWDDTDYTEDDESYEDDSDSETDSDGDDE